MFILVMNPVMTNAECQHIVARASTKEELQQLVTDNRLEENERIGECSYAHKEGPLRDMNGLYGSEMDGQSFNGHGIFEHTDRDEVEQLVNKYQQWWDVTFSNILVLS